MWVFWKLFINFWFQFSYIQARSQGASYLCPNVCNAVTFFQTLLVWYENWIRYYLERASIDIPSSSLVRQGCDTASINVITNHVRAISIYSSFSLLPLPQGARLLRKKLLKSRQQIWRFLCEKCNTELLQCFQGRTVRTLTNSQPQIASFRAKNLL